MKKPITMYELSQAADNDIEAIFDYTIKQFGITQAIKYVTSFEAVFENLVNNPEIGRKRDEVKKGLRSLIKESHIIFYRIMKDRIRIIRVLHVNRDLPRFFVLSE